jgi:hypothetical protein
MHAKVLDRLVCDEQFGMQQAIAIGEAIDLAIENAQLVTVPIFNAAFARLEARLDASEKATDARFEAGEKRADERFAAAEKRADERFKASKDEMNARFAAAEKRADERFAAAENGANERFTAFEVKMEARTDSKFVSLRYQVTVIALVLLLGAQAFPKVVEWTLTAFRSLP